LPTAPELPDELPPELELLLEEPPLELEELLPEELPPELEELLELLEPPLEELLPELEELPPLELELPLEEPPPELEELPLELEPPLEDEPPEDEPPELELPLEELPPLEEPPELELPPEELLPLEEEPVLLDSSWWQPASPVPAITIVTRHPNSDRDRGRRCRDDAVRSGWAAHAARCCVAEESPPDARPQNSSSLRLMSMPPEPRNHRVDRTAKRGKSACCLIAAPTSAAP